MKKDAAETLTLKERMLSAGTGSILTSLMLTPMDVVRIRLQQQEMLPDCTCNPSGVEEINFKRSTHITDLSSVNISSRMSNHNAVVNESKVFWEQACFKELNCKNSEVKYNGTWGAFKQIAKSEGPSTLWRGISLTLLMGIPANVVYFTGYEYIRDISPFALSHSTINPLFCGALARIIAATTVAPLELTKTKFQSIPRSSRNTRSWTIFKDLLTETRQDIKLNGIFRSLFRGLEITLWRDVPFSAVYWGSYEFCKKNIWIDNSKEEKNTIHFINSFVSGCISGSIAAIITHPFDVGKTRKQISFVSTGNHNNKNLRSNKNMLEYLIDIRNKEGYRALYTGLTARIVKIAPSCAIMISSYEISKKFFNVM